MLSNEGGFEEEEGESGLNTLLPPSSIHTQPASRIERFSLKLLETTPQL
jgi:hypothetical protein